MLLKVCLGAVAITGAVFAATGNGWVLCTFLVAVAGTWIAGSWERWHE